MFQQGKVPPASMAHLLRFGIRTRKRERRTSTSVYAEKVLEELNQDGLICKIKGAALQKIAAPFLVT